MLLCIFEMIQGSSAIHQLRALAVDVNIDFLGGWRFGSRLVIIGMNMHSFKAQTPIDLVGLMDSERQKEFRVSESGCFSSKVMSVCCTKIDGSF